MVAIATIPVPTSGPTVPYGVDHKTAPDSLNITYVTHAITALHHPTDGIYDRRGAIGPVPGVTTVAVDANPTAVEPTDAPDRPAVPSLMHYNTTGH